MALLDFLTQPRLKVTRGDQMNVTPYAAPEEGAGDGLLSSAVEPLQMGAPETLTQAPQIEEKPSLLQGAIKFLTSPQSIAALGAGLNGDPASVQMAADIGARRRDMAAKAEAEQKAKADLARKNAAFKAAYQGGRFNPQAYLDAIGDEGDASEAFSLAKALAPQGGVDGGTAYTRDPLTGEVQWGEQRPMSPAERLAEERAAALEAYREEQIRLAEERQRLAERREGRVAAGGGRGGRGGGSAKPVTHGASLAAVEAALRKRGLIP